MAQAPLIPLYIRRCHNDCKANGATYFRTCQQQGSFDPVGDADNYYECCMSICSSTLGGYVPPPPSRCGGYYPCVLPTQPVPIPPNIV